MKNKLKKFIQKLDIDNPPRHVSIGGEVIAEYSEDYSKPKNYGKSKKEVVQEFKKKKVKKDRIVIGDEVSNSSYGKGKVIRTQRETSKKGKVSVQFKSGKKDVSKEALNKVKKGLKTDTKGRVRKNEY